MTLRGQAALTVFLGLLAAGHAGAQLTVSDDGRFLEYQSGESFIYLADTAWELFHKLDRDEADAYLQDRADKGFTVIQAVVLAELDGLRTPNAYGEIPLHDMDPQRPNEKYFEHVDYIVARATDLGLFVAMLPSWGDKLPSDSPGAGPVVFNPQNAREFGRFLGERYRNQRIIWVLGGDRLVSAPETFATWRAMAQGLETGHQGRQLMTFHPRGYTSSSYWFHDDDWLDFNMFQSGHGSRFQPNYDFVVMDRARLPTKPVVDGEPAYEGIPVRFWEYMDFSQPSPRRVPADVLDDDNLIVDSAHFEEGFFEREDLRPHLYWCLFSGAAGYTYGANAIWQMFERGDDFAIPAREDWREALQLPGATDIAHVRSLFAYRPLSVFQPDQSVVYGPNPEGAGHARALLAGDRRSALVYFPRRETITVRVDNLTADGIDYRWFDPASGAISTAEPSGNAPAVSFKPPTTGDWVLIIDSSGAYPASSPGDSSSADKGTAGG